MNKPKHLSLRGLGICLSVSAIVLFSGCATTSGSNVTVSAPTLMTTAGFLTDYARLKSNPDIGGTECWRAPAIDASKYDKVLISRILVSLAPAKKEDSPKAIDPSDLTLLTDYFHKALTKNLEKQMTVVDKAGPGVLVIRIALTDLVPTQVSRSVAGTLIPYGFVAEAGSGVAAGLPAGSTPYLGETGMEMQFRDGASNTVLAECRDTQIGRKYAADVDAGASGATETWVDGYMNSFQSWSYAKNAMDKWSLLLATRLAHLRGVTPTK
ncbi:MAG: DUF3313 domain-containing protein [Propionivibrio sp.]|nr:DUF3313 domain-containing protein [Propionivibrio sp.]